MLRFLPGSLRCMQLLLNHLVEMKDRAVGHQHSNGMEKLHYIAKSIGTPLSNERFDYFSNFHQSTNRNV